MPHLKSLAGLGMVAKYVSNWYCILALYANIIPKTTARFKDGRGVDVYKNNHIVFYEEIYKRHLQNHGFICETKGKEEPVRTPEGLVIMLRPPYSFVLDEIFLMKVYGQPQLKGRVVIDIGTSFGDSALYFASLGASKVYCFEADKDLYQMAQENISLNNMTGKIYIYNQKATGELLRILILEYRLKNVFLKVDCEGCEYEVIKNMGHSMFESIRDIVMEYHRQPEPLIGYLTRLGFRIKRKRRILFASKC
jgi:hypothetical protein